MIWFWIATSGCSSTAISALMIEAVSSPEARPLIVWGAFWLLVLEKRESVVFDVLIVAVGEPLALVEVLMLVVLIRSPRRADAGR